MSRVLLFCPTHRLQPETILAIHGMQYSGALDTMFTLDNPYGEGSGRNIFYNYQKAERIIGGEGYDYLFIIENDIIPPPDALLKLEALDADIAYGVYCFRRGRPIINIQRHDGEQTSYGMPNNLQDWARAWGKIIPCAGLGFGCTLIKRSVFDVAPLHSDSGGDADSQLAADARRMGLKQMTDTTVLCGHKKPDGVTIWPTSSGFYEVGQRIPLPMKMIRAIRQIAFWDEYENAIIIQPGEIRPIDVEHAAAFVNSGLVSYV